METRHQRQLRTTCEMKTLRREVTSSRPFQSAKLEAPEQVRPELPRAKRRPTSTELLRRAFRPAGKPREEVFLRPPLAVGAGSLCKHVVDRNRWA